MKTYYITFRSVTYAQRGESVLNRAGVRCAIQRAPRWMEAQGCGYALRILTDDLGFVTEELRRKFLPLRKIYVQHTDGVLEEVQP